MTTIPPVVLVVDDDARVATILQAYLGARGYRVELCEDACDVPSRMREIGAQLVILDVLMPGCDGVEVCGRIRAEGLTAPVIMLSSKVLQSDVLRAMMAGANDYLTKPIDLKKLELSVSTLLRDAAGPRP